MVFEKEEEPERKKLSNAEFELNRFKEIARQDRIKKQLMKFRRKDTIFNTPKNMEIIQDQTIFPQSKRKKKKGFKKGKNSLLNIRGGLF